MTEQTVRGRCLCGDVRYEYRGEPVATLHCHCESCRRHTSSPVATFVCVSKASFRLLGGAPTVYVSSPGVHRARDVSAMRVVLSLRALIPLCP